MPTYRAFIGCWDDGDPEWTIVDTGGLSWEEARELLLHNLRAWKDDDCQDCRKQAEAEFLRLQSAIPETPFSGEVNGDDYMILAQLQT